MSFFSPENRTKDISNKLEEERKEKSASVYRISADIASLKPDPVATRFRGQITQERSGVHEHKYLLLLPKEAH